MSEGKPVGINFFENFDDYADEEKKVITDEINKVLKNVNLEHQSIDQVSETVQTVNLTTVDILKKLSNLSHLINENRDVFDKFENWSDITGLPQKKLDAMDTSEVVELVRKKGGLSKGNIFKRIPPTKYPETWITPKDKLSDLLFNGGLNEELTPLKMEERSRKKELTDKVNINFDALENISISRDLSPYDREVHDSIVSLYIDGGNEYITPLMIYRTMTGNPKAKLLPKQQVAILESVARCSSIKITIELIHKMKKVIYEGNLIYTEKVRVEHLGKFNEWVHILREPILYGYASSKNQVGRLDIKLLNTPSNKNEETIVLEGYLRRRIQAMKSSNVSRTIIYETIYKYLNLSSESPEAERNKKKKIRDSIAVALTFFKDQGFICGYTKKDTKNLNIELEKGSPRGIIDYA